MREGNTADAKNRLVVGVSGASGIELAIRLLKTLRLEPDWESHLVVTRGAKRVLAYETNLSVDALYSLADVVYDEEDIGASIASGTFRTAGMVVVPCSMKTVAGIANGYSDNLLLRAADVTLKERRRLVVAARETPLSLAHLRNLTTLFEYGAVIMPPMLAYYNHPKSLTDVEHHLVCKMLGEFGIEPAGFRRWERISRVAA